MQLENNLLVLTSADVELDDGVTEIKLDLSHDGRGLPVASDLWDYVPEHACSETTCTLETDKELLHIVYTLGAYFFSDKFDSATCTFISYEVSK